MSVLWLGRSFLELSVYRNCNKLSLAVLLNGYFGVLKMLISD